MATSANTLTIEGHASETLARLESEASRRGVTASDFARHPLQQSLGASPPTYHDLDAPAGTW
jgi:hypothetical protein